MLARKNILFICTVRKWDLFVPFKIVCRLHPWMALTHVRNPFVLAPPVGLFHFTNPRWILDVREVDFAV